jgi:hypothetical protein
MNLKSFDIFRKIQTDVHPGTKTGGMFTVMAFILGGLLLFHSLSEYYTEKYTTSLIIENDEATVLPVRINILMSNAPCHGTNKFM